MILSVGEVNRNKNHRLVIEAMPKLKTKAVHYVICGKGDLESGLIQLAKEFGVDDRVHLAGYRSDVADFYLAADIFAFPSQREGLPVAVMEAMACRLPVVGTNTRGIVDLIEHGKNGCLAEPTPEAFESGIRQLMHDEKLREAYAAASYEKIQQFSLNTVVAKMKDIYTDAMGS